MVRKYGGKNYENKKESKPRSTKMEKSGRTPVGKTEEKAENKEKE